MPGFEAPFTTKQNIYKEEDVEEEKENVHIYT